MLVKFHLKTGDTVTLAARNKKGKETNDLGDAIRVFKDIYGDDVPFMLDKDYKSRKERELNTAIRVAEEAEAAYQTAPRMVAA